jgi:hypothetical protein
MNQNSTGGINGSPQIADIRIGRASLRANPWSITGRRPLGKNDSRCPRILGKNAGKIQVSVTENSQFSQIKKPPDALVIPPERITITKHDSRIADSKHPHQEGLRGADRR